MNWQRLGSNSGLAAAMAGLIGLVGMWEATDYAFGSARRIGPAVFPFGLSLLLFLSAIGIVLERALQGERADDRLDQAPAVVLLCILGGLLAFALSVERFGLAPAIFACVIISSLADRSLRPITVIVVAAFMATICSLVFVTLLNLPISIVEW